MNEQTEHSKYKATAYRLLAGEVVLTVAIVFLLSISINAIAAYSAVLGGVAFILPNLLFARFAFRHSAAVSTGLVMRWFYIGEAIKILTTVLILALCFIWVKPLNVAVLLITYIVLLLINVQGLALLMNK